MKRVAISLLSALVVVGVSGTPASAATVFESFTGAGLSSTPASQWSEVHDASSLPMCLTALDSTSRIALGHGTLVGCASPAIDSPGHGALRLTGISGGITSLTDLSWISAASGFQASFELAQYGGAGNGDGITLFATTGRGSVGVGGGGLGYVGMPHALFGVGFDAYGNFSNPPAIAYNWGNECPGGNGIGQTPNSVVVRGPDVSRAGDGSAGYCYLGGSSQTAAFVGTNRSDASHFVRVVVDGTTTHNPSISIYFGGSSKASSLPSSPTLRVPVPSALLHTSSYRIGFSAGTGSAQDVNEIWNLQLVATFVGGSRVSTIASAIPLITGAFSSRHQTLVNAGLAGASLLVLVFPSQLFNHTFLENYETIAGWWRRRFLWWRQSPRASLTADEVDATTPPHPESAPVAHASRHVWAALRRWTAVIIVLVGGSILGGVLDPRFGWNVPSVIATVTILLSTVVVIAIPGYIEFRFRRWRQLGRRFRVEALPAGLLIGLLCVLISRLSHFEPGYLYGVICILAFARQSELETRDEGRLASVAIVTLVLLALLAWLALLPLHTGSGVIVPWWRVVLEDLAGTLFVTALVAGVIGSLPLSFLPGGRVFAWRKSVWLVITFFSVFVLFQSMVNPHATTEGSGSIVTTTVLFALFSACSIWMYAHFRRRKDQPSHGAASDLIDDIPIAGVE